MRKAAELLHVSQPALSKTTRLLQEELGVPLITHVGRNIVLTDQGRRLADRAHELLRDFEALRSEIENGAQDKEEMKLATFEVFSTYTLEILRHLDWENTALTLHDVLPGELENAVATRQVDLGLTYMPIPHPDLEFLKICSLEMGVFTHVDAFKGVRQDQLPFVVPVMPITGSPTRVRGLDGWPEDAYPRQIRYRVTLMESGLELCRQGRAAGYFPVFIVGLHNARVAPELRLGRRPSIYPGRVCETDVFLVKRRSDLESRRAKQLARAIRKVCRP